MLSRTEYYLMTLGEVVGGQTDGLMDILTLDLLRCYMLQASWFILLLFSVRCFLIAVAAFYSLFVAHLLYNALDLMFLCSVPGCAVLSVIVRVLSTW